MNDKHLIFTSMLALMGMHEVIENIYNNTIKKEIQETEDNELNLLNAQLKRNRKNLKRINNG